MSQHFLHRTARIFDKAREDGQVANPPPDPLDETRLAQEIARIIEKRPVRSAAAAARTAKSQWLGEEDDRAFVERFAATTAKDSADGAAPTVDMVVAPEALDVDETASSNGAAPTDRSAAMTADWVKKARRQRLRARLRDVAGWTVSIAVSVALVIAVSVAMFGWPNGGAILKQLQVKSIDVSTLDDHR